jgi:hypothetical protein
MPLMATRPAEFSRRGFLSALGGLAALPAFAGSSLGASLLSTSDAPLFASAFKKSVGGYGVAVLDDLGQIQAEISLPGRGHGIAVSETRECFAAFARRPGIFAVVAWPFSGRPMQTIVAAPGRHYYGHGCFSKDGRILYAVENDFEAARGVVGVYDVSGETITRLGEFDSHGIGPHEVLLSKDGNVLIVANGGIETHPDHGREKLNLETMSPTVVFLDVKTGDLLAEHRLDSSLHQLSLRHMALDGTGRAWAGGQFQGSKTDTPPLVAIISRDEAPVLLDLPEKLAGQLENYIGSVTATTDQNVIATSAPRGGKTLFWSAETGDYLGHHNIADGCGVAPIDQGSFLISDGNGGVSYLPEPGGRAEILARPAGFAWDNHMTALRI